MVTEVANHLAMATSDPLLLHAMLGLQNLRADAVESRSGQLSIAVLPFANLSGDVSQQYLCDGITEDIIIRLARFTALRVAARSAAFGVQSLESHGGDAARSLGARYVVRGTVLKNATRLIVSCQLTDTTDGALLWGERYDRIVEDVFAVQDEVIGRIVTVLGGRVVTAGASAIRKKPTENWSAYDFLLKGRELCNRGQEKDSIPFFEKAAELDPDFALAHAWSAIGYLGRFWHSAESSCLDMASQCVGRALAIDADDATAHHAAGMICNYQRQYERSATHFKRAIELNPLDVNIAGDYGSLLLHVGRVSDSIAIIQEALHRDPYAPSWMFYALGKSLFFADRYEEALRSLERAGSAIARNHAFLAACHAALGHDADAKREVELMYELNPGIDTDHFLAALPLSDRTQLDRFFAALRRAGFAG